MITRKECVYKISGKTGFFAVYNLAITLIDYCLQKGYVPVFDFGSYIYKNEDTSKDPWSSFFLPLEIYKEPYKISSRVDFLISSKPPLTCLSDHSYSPLFSTWNSFPEDKKTRIGIKNISRFIKIREDILEEADNYVKKHFRGKKVTGIHIRHTDHWTDKLPYLKDGIAYHSFNEYIAAVKKNNDFDLLYVATDSQENISKLKFIKELRGKIIYNNFLRATTQDPIHLCCDQYGYDPVRLGREILIEALILSKCDKLIGSVSNITLAALFWNPSLPFVNIAQMVESADTQE